MIVTGTAVVRRLAAAEIECFTPRTKSRDRYRLAAEIESGVPFV